MINFKFLLKSLFLSIVLLLGVRVKGFAQFNQCQNPNPVPYYCYDTSYNPVCGCDQHTYQNYCQWSQAGLLSYTPRICEEVAIAHLYPNPIITSQGTWINYRIYLRQQEDAFVYIYDEYGKSHYYHFFEHILDDTEILDLSSLQSGPYIMVVVANGHYASRKFIKY